MSSASASTGAWSWLSTADSTIAAGWISGVLTAIATVTAVMVAAWFAYRHAREHSQRAHMAAIRVDRLHREVDALERIWGLLAYMTFGENDSAIVHWREDRQEKHTTYYVNMTNLRRFILTEMPAAFYTQHAGLHLPKDIRDQLFDYAGSLMGLHLKYEKVDPANAEPIALKNQQLIDKLRNAFDSLNASLKAAVEQRYLQMLDVE